MTVTAVQKDAEARTMRLTAEFDATPERVWQLWADPRQLERWWGPPTYPATFQQHEFYVGGRSHYYMTGPDGNRIQPRGWWSVEAVEPPNRFVFLDGFADENWEPSDIAKPGRVVVTLEDIGGRTRMTSVNYSPDLETLEQLLNMGVEEGMREAAGQIDGLLASQPAR